MGNADFWQVIDRQLTELRSARSADDVVRILATENNPYGDPHISGSPAFFAGGGGDETVRAALSAAGWRLAWSKAPYYYAMTAPDGSAITYTEGDIDLGA